ncbi:hypothetical protein [Haloactinomyces albus]|uniref:Lipoprotein n=1 Tax=Haloactinomyces albus TaxID=1352928 RepID=A0AAE3ZAQ7_9ACTN|nr:hypothetical protein [Haloactinomyces albus]MDR7301442.1 hypothetical protein [Haloactinomyces albus]
MTRRVGRLTVLGALVFVPVVAGCGGGDTAGPQRGVTVEELQQEQYFYQGNYLGRTVTISAAVSEVRGPQSFELSGGDFGDDTLLVVTSRPVEIEEGRVVRVTGTAGQLHYSFPSEQVPYIQRGLYAKYATEAYLYEASVEPLSTSRR